MSAPMALRRHPGCARECEDCAILGGFLFGDLGALFAGLGKANGDRLLATLHRSALPAGAGFQRAMFLAPHGAGDSFSSGLAIAATR